MVGRTETGVRDGANEPLVVKEVLHEVQVSASQASPKLMSSKKVYQPRLMEFGNFDKIRDYQN